jgi:hypothetical protein
MGPIINPANQHVYYLLSPNTWSNSEAEAISLGGHLVTINDAAENGWVIATFAGPVEESRPLWIGFTDRDSEGIFQWVSGQPATYVNWNTRTDEPNNSGGSGYEEDFAYIVQQNSGNPDLLATFWNDVPNDGYGVIPPTYGVAEVEPPTPVVNGNQVCWQTIEGVTYQAQWKIAHSKGEWVNFGPEVIGTGQMVCVSGHRRPGKGRLYRVRVL